MAADVPVFLALTGPTASGKTELSLALAERVGAEVVSMDSRQVYRGMDIGTDKVSPEARARVPHHGLDLVDPDELYSAGRFARDARRWIDEIRGRAALPVLVGGTGFFLRSLMEPIFSQPTMDPKRVLALRSYLKRQDRRRLERWVEQLDPERAPLARDGGPQRMGRTLEVSLLSGRPLSWWHVHAPSEGEGLPGVVVVLEIDTAEMDHRIDARVSGMLSRGLVEEVRGLLERGYGAGTPGMTGTGYREIVRYLRGRTTLGEAADEIRRNTRRYARRQRTWFRHQLPEDVCRVEAAWPLAKQVDRVVQVWERSVGAGAAGGSGPDPGPGGAET